MTRYLIITQLLLLFALTTLIGQNQIIGKIIDENSNSPLEYATISVINTANNEVVNGGITNENGEFLVETKLADFHIQITYLGYESIELKNNQITKSPNKQIDLGMIRLKPDQETLDEVTVVAEKSQTVFQLDKRVFNVGKDLSTSGGSALDVLNNVPSVDVNMEGAITLRGSTGVQILINGKPSVLTSGNSNTLGTITAAMIEKVEVITNPSAKYDAEGTTGIINIILKKDERKGFNGSISLNTGVPNNHSVGLSINQRTEKFNLFGQLGAGKRTFLSNYSGLTINRRSTSQNELRSTGEAEKNEEFYNLLLGADFLINKYNVITLSGHLGYEIEDEFSDTYYDLSTPEENLLQSFSRNEVTEGRNPKYHYELQYKKTFKNNEERSLMASAIGSFFGKEQPSQFVNETSFGDAPGFQQQSNSDFSNASYVFQTDYVHPINEKTTFETGIKYQLNVNKNDYEVLDFENGIWVNNPNFTNEFNFDQAVIGLYATYAYEWEKFGVKAGLRLEDTRVDVSLITTGENSNQNYTNAFPSIHASYKFQDQFSVQLGYSRRIQRPSGWDLNPFSTIRDNLNLSIGNPNLQPEFTDAYELTAISTWDKVSLSGAVFHRKTNNVVNNVLTVIDSLAITSPQNVGLSENTGIEINGKYDPFEWLSLLMDANWVYFQRSGSLENDLFDFSNTRWESRFTSKLNLPNNWDIEVRARYQSAYQGIITNLEDVFFMDLGIRKKILRGRGVLNFSVRDLFNSRKFIEEADQPTFYRLDASRWNVRSFVLGFSYSFGKGEAMEYSGRKLF